MRLRNRLAMAIAITLPVTVGCGIQPETVTSFRRAAAQSIQHQASAATRLDTTPVKAVFHPSYPDRKDPFSFPYESTLESPGPDTSIKSAAQVDVVGFADLGQPRVFLRARDKTHSLTVGEKAYGVEVVEIRPPAVRLRMGSLTWTATMFDDTSSRPQR